ncbi:BCL2/adenovirus E1B 19 kDa protein-interacting protein 3-like [Limulus polyphemus]|uniref:BCL2/adenovirus E1B 19 kDa protein-interacting protein 3-like n=1 Tax=Limulus polyphemus TaxID=6850 RepID=A0ABM1BPR9_LIMPO|nr:BCL2/adenovirus E1B 19 kDa protein-interacting protein 3-like [Limulus polyphemus]
MERYNSMESLPESWGEFNMASRESTRACTTPVLLGGSGINGNIEKMLWEAQRESNQSSAIASRKSSHGNSPKSPHSPVIEPSHTPNELLIINKEDLLVGRRQVATDWIWDWSSRPDQLPPKEWKFKHPQRAGLSLRHSKVVKHGLFSTEVLSILVLTNLLSLILGAGIGLFIGRRLGTSISAIGTD